MLAHHYIVVLSANCLLVLSNLGSVAAQVQVPDYLNPSPNLLRFPTKAEEVRIRGTQPITLAQALVLAQRNNLALQEALLKVERRRAALLEVQADMYPTISLSAESDSDRLFAEQSSTSKQAQLLSIQNFFFNQNQLTTTFCGQDQPTTTFCGSVQLTYGLYNYKKGNSSRQVAEEQVRVDQLDVERQSEEIRLNVSTGYYDLQQADQSVRIYQAAVLNYQASLRDALALERAGVGTRFDVLQAQANLATNGVQPLTSAFAQQRIARRRFAVLLSLTQSVDVSASDPVQLAGIWNQTLEESIILAFQNRPELQQQIAQRNIAESQRKIVLSGLKPNVDFVASYNLKNVFNDSVSANDGYLLGVNANVNLLDGGSRRAHADQERINIRIADTKFANQRNQIRYEVENYYFQLQSNLQNVQTSTVALSLATEALRQARLRFQAGTGTQTDVITQEALLIKAEGNRVNTILNYNRALANLQRAVTSRALR